MYSSQSFDTHKFVKSFTLAGLAENQAEAIVTAIVQSRDYDLSKLATKDQLETVKLQIEGVKAQVQSIKDEMKLVATKDHLEIVRAQLDAKIDSSSIAQLDAKIDSSIAQLDSKIDSSVAQLDAKIDSSISKLEANLLRWFVATAIALSGIMIAAVKFIH